MQILLVEDDADVRSTLELSLLDAGYAVTSAGTAGEALGAVNTWTPDLVLLDLMLPDLPGEDVYRALRKDPRTCTAAIIIVSARSGESDRVAGLELGADDYVAKPFSMRLLLLRIEAVLKRTRPGRARGADSQAAFQAAGPLTMTERTTT